MASKDNHLSGEILKLTISNICAQLLPFFAIPVLSRLFLPQAFALKAFITYANNLFDLVFRFSISIPVFKKDIDAYETWRLTITLSLFLSIILSIILFFFPPSLMNLLVPNLQQFIYWIIPLPFFGAIIQANTFWLVRKKLFVRVGLVTVSRTLCYVGLSLLCGIIGWTDNLLLLKIFVISVISGGIFSTIILLKNFVSIKLINFSINDLWKSIRANKIYIKNGPFFAILENLGSLLPLLLISKFYSLEKSGIFSLVTYLFLAPSSVIASSINQVLMGSVQKYKEDNELKIAIKKLTIVLAAAALCGIVITLICAPSLLPYFLGEKWLEAGKTAQILITPFGLRFVTNSLSSIIIALGYIQYIARWQFIYFICMVTLIPISYIGFSFETFLIIFSIVDFLAYSIQGLIILYIMYLPSLLKNPSPC